MSHLRTSKAETRPDLGRLKVLATLTYVQVIVTCLDYVNIPPEF